jgi:gluconokinase
MFLGIDIGTTAIKVGVLEAREIIYQQTYPIQTKINQSRTQSASEIEEQLMRSFSELPSSLRKQISVIGFSTAMHSIMPVINDTFEDIYIWSDNQASQVIENFRQTSLSEEFYRQTGTPIHAMSPFAKLLYFKSEEVYPSNTKWYGLKELVMLLFTGKAMIDRSTASATGLYSLNQANWSQEILDYLSLSSEQLAPICDTTDCFPISIEAATRFGLDESVQIMCGASDGCLAAYAGYISTGIKNSLTIGTSAAVRKVTNQVAFDRRQNFCYYLNEDQFVVGAPSNNGGTVLAWIKENLAQDPTTFYKDLPRIVEESPIGSNGLRFFPFINGERAPFWKGNIKASYHGLTMQHTRSDMIHAALEGMLLNIRVLKEMTGITDEVTISGGVFQTKAIAQMTADILGITCYLSPANEPIFGLYDLYFGQSSQPDKEYLQAITPNKKNSEQYETLAQDYFE